MDGFPINREVHPETAVKVDSSALVREIGATSKINVVAFRRWRPTYHVIAPHGWMNDPCAPFYNPRTKTYHLAFQWNPKGYVWGNIAWGSARSKDLLRWEVATTPSMDPNSYFDQGGVFTGCMAPEIGGVGPSPSLVAFYTSAQILPINFKLPYIRGSERLHIATSSDEGRSWKRSQDNVVLAGPPESLSVTGWRDPFVRPWESLSKALDHSQGLYGVLSGGIRDKTPTVFLYHVSSDDIMKWDFLGPLLNVGFDFRPSKWSGDFGKNWEVANFLTLHDGAHSAFEIVIVSAEGITIDPSTGGELSTAEATRRQMWMCIDLKPSDGFQAQYKFGGVLDHGTFYAANGFHDPITGSFVVFGWVDEEDLPNSLVKKQNWAGTLSIPRILSLQTLKSVTSGLKSNLNDITSLTYNSDGKGTNSITTLAIKPDPRLESLRTTKLTSTSTNIALPFPMKSCQQWELQLAFRVGNSDLCLGFDIAHTSDFSRHTTVLFYPSTERIVVDRSLSTTIPEINLSPKVAPHTLFRTREDEDHQRIEDLEFHVYYDTSLLELFVNERTAITTRIYPESGTCMAVRPILEERGPPQPPRDLDLGAGGSQHDSSLLRCDLWTLRPCPQN